MCKDHVMNNEQELVTEIQRIFDKLKNFLDLDQTDFSLVLQADIEIPAKLVQYQVQQPEIGQS